MRSLKALVAIMARVMLCGIFILDAVGSKIPNFDENLQRMRTTPMPYPQILLVGAVVCLISGSVAVMLGFKARFGAFLLLAFLFPATLFFHNFWALTDPRAREMQLHEFLKNISMAGALLLILVNGAGPGSLDGKGGR